jgi:hypothetical protein
MSNVIFCELDKRADGVSYDCSCGKSVWKNLPFPRYCIQGGEFIEELYCTHDPDAETPFSLVLDPETAPMEPVIRLPTWHQGRYGINDLISERYAVTAFASEFFVRDSKIMRTGREGDPVPVSLVWLQRELSKRFMFLEWRATWDKTVSPNIFLGEGWLPEDQCPEHFARSVLEFAQKFETYGTEPCAPKHQLIGIAANWKYEDAIRSGWTNKVLVARGLMIEDPHRADRMKHFP